ncbi:MAG: PHP domain-containing protein [Oscillospiraceae bacterium]|nr:PHP domain-containing protein [Oscillospiraceae bacterium]
MKEQILKKYPYRIELHAHTAPASACSHLKPEELVQLYHEKGYDGVVITNHFDPDKLSLDKKEAVSLLLQDYIRAKEAAKKYAMTVYLGVELRFQENINDYLIYGVDEKLLEIFYDYIPTDVVTFRREVALPHSVFLQAHPFRGGMTLCDAELLDGMECLNLHPRHNSAVGLATQYAYQKALRIKIAGSDCHDRGDQGMTALRCKALPEDSFQLAQLLKTGDYVFEIGGASLWIP